MDWKQVIRARLWGNIKTLALSEAKKRELLETELARAITDTEVGRPLRLTDAL